MNTTRTQEPVVSEAGHIDVAGRDRTYLAVMPASSQARHEPVLLLVLHGSNQTGKKVQAFSGHTFDDLAATAGIIVVYPDAYKGLWNDARKSLQSPARRENIDDVAFIQALIRHFHETRGTNQVFVAGYSNGGQLAIRLIHEIPDQLSGAALIGATQPTSDNFLASDKHLPLPVQLIHGTKDPLVPYAGGVASLWGFRPRGAGLSALDSAAYFAQRNGITAPSVTETLPHLPRSGNTSVRVTRFEQEGKKPVVLYTVENGGHVIPNPRKNALFIYGRTTHDINAAEVIWRFFEPQLAA